MSFIRFRFPLLPALLALLLIAGCDTQEEEPLPDVEIEELIVGDGRVAEEGTIAKIDYIGMLTNGDVFESSHDEGLQPIEILMGTRLLIRDQFVIGEVIPGLALGVEGMRVGGKRRIHIPQELAYGSNGVGCNPVGDCLIPPFSPLIFEVDLLAVRDQPE